MLVEVILPKLGVTMSEGRIVKWLKNEGEYVKQGEPLVEIETDKVTQEVESPVEGHLKEIIGREDMTLEVNSVIALIDE